MTTASIDVPEQARPFRRTAWKPVVQEGDGAPGASKFAGIPWLARADDWAICPICGEPIQLFVQLDLDNLPAEIAGQYGGGLLQMFYCTNTVTTSTGVWTGLHYAFERGCEDLGEGWGPFAKNSVVRIVRPAPGEQPADMTESPVRDPFPPKLIVGWKPVDDYPHRDELEEQLGVELTKEQRKAMWELELPRSGDKLAGWPYWVQNMEYPRLPRVRQADALRLPDRLRRQSALHVR